jgi:hypothetical protein
VGLDFTQNRGTEGREESRSWSVEHSSSLLDMLTGRYLRG